MLTKGRRAKAKGAREVFATTQTHTGNGSDPPGNGKAPSYGRSSNNAIGEATGYSQPGGAQPQSHGTRVLLDERPLVLLPSLAMAVGVDGAIVLQQLHYYLLNPKCGREHQGHRWIYNTYEQWQAHDFPFWSVRTIRRLFRQLERKRLVLACQPEGRANRRKYYRIDHERLDKIVGAGLARARGSGQNARFDAAKSGASITNRSNKEKKVKGVLANTASPFCPKVPYPKSEAAMAATLAELGIEYVPDYDGQFFKQMQTNGWTTGGGQPVWDWPGCYQARLEVTFPGLHCGRPTATNGAAP